MSNSDHKTNTPARRVSSIDVARAAGVSQATVSYVFNGRKGYVVPDLTRDRVLQAAAELGYTPNKNAQSLKTGRTKTIALWIANVRTPIAAEVLRRVIDCVEADRYEVIIGGSGQNSSTASWPVDGILAFDSRHELKSMLERGHLPKVPVVSMGPYHFDQIDHVAVKLYSATHAAVKQMVEVGHKRIAYMGPGWSLTRGDERFDAYSDALREAGLQPELMPITDNTRLAARQDLKKYLASSGCPNSIVCYNDEVAVGVLRSLYDLNIRVPDDISLIGCDGIAEMAYHCPSISTITQPLDEMCAMGWKFLFNRMNNPNLSIQHTALSATYIDRESTSKKDQNYGSNT